MENNNVLAKIHNDGNSYQIFSRDAEDFISNGKAHIEKLKEDITRNEREISCLNSQIENCGRNVISQIKGKIFGTVTESVLKEALTELSKNQLNGIYYPLIRIVSITNENTNTTSKIVQGLMALQLIVAYQVIENTKVETERAKRIATLSEKVKNGNVTMDELIDLALENSELQGKTFNDIYNRLQNEETKNKKLTELINESCERLAKDVKAIQDDFNEIKKKHESKIIEIESTFNKKITEVENNEEHKIKNIQDSVQNGIRETVSKLQTRIDSFDNILNKQNKTIKRLRILVITLGIFVAISAIVLLFKLI